MGLVTFGSGEGDQQDDVGFVEISTRCVMQCDFFLKADLFDTVYCKEATASKLEMYASILLISLEKICL